jgi:GT2 family glycosyltransferase
VSEPRFSIVTPVYETPAAVLRAMLASVRTQTFQDWELCLVDDGSLQPHVRGILDKARSNDPRIRVSHRDSNGGIVQASNDALEMARGEFIALLDHDDELSPDALAQVDQAIRATPEADYVYSDEDKIGADGLHYDTFYKPDWSPERLRTQMYTCHLSVLRRSLVEQVGGFDADFEGSQDWDLVLKVTERSRAVAHVPKVLYHWRALDTSAARRGVEAKPLAFEAGTRAVQAHCDRIGLPAKVEQDPADSGVYHLQPALDKSPPVSIVIPTGGRAGEVGYKPVILVVNCVRSILSTSTYDAYEIVCVVDDSTPPAVLDELKDIAGDRLRLVHYDRPFSFSAKINLGAIRSEGEHLLMLNDDVEVVTPDWIERMVMYSGLPDIGAVGGRLRWRDGRLQHVGVMFHQGRPNHIYWGFPGDFSGYFNNVLVAENYLAVTGACLMTAREVFEELGGLSTTLPINFNDIDYCFKLWSSGRRVVYDPVTVMYHFESSSRSPFVEEWEINGLTDRWLPISNVDPFSNPNFRGGSPGQYPTRVSDLLRSSGTRLRSGLRRRLVRTS